MKIEYYYEEKDIKHLIKRLEPLIKTKINWCKIGIKIPFKDKVIDRLVSDLKYMLENPEFFKDKQNEFECVCMHDDKCCECGKELIEDDYECGPEPFADEMYDFYILHRRCPECEGKKMLKARDFIMNFDDPLKYKRSISKSSSKDLERKLENFWMIKILLTNSGEKESQEVYERIKAYSDKLTSIGPTILVSELEEKCVKENFSEEKDIRR